jgi:hypothetical protein
MGCEGFMSENVVGLTDKKWIMLDCGCMNSVFDCGQGKVV